MPDFKKQPTIISHSRILPSLTTRVSRNRQPVSTLKRVCFDSLFRKTKLRIELLLEMDSYQVVTAANVNVIITSNVTSHVVEKRFAKQVTIGELKVQIVF